MKKSEIIVCDWIRRRISQLSEKIDFFDGDERELAALKGRRSMASEIFNYIITRETKEDDDFELLYEGKPEPDSTVAFICPDCRECVEFVRAGDISSRDGNNHIQCNCGMVFDVEVRLKP